jgi:hypothetical protein
MFTAGADPGRECGRTPVWNRFWLTQIWSKGKNVGNQNEGVGRGTRVRVRAREVSTAYFEENIPFYTAPKIPKKRERERERERKRQRNTQRK